MELQVFNMISNLKGLQKVDLIVDEDDEYFMKASYKRVKQHLNYRLWKKIIKNYSIDSLSNIYDSCNILLDVVIKKYETNGN
jgi:hypothetical protein